MPTTAAHPNTTATLALELEACGYAVNPDARPNRHLIGSPADWWERADPDGHVTARVCTTVAEGFDVYAFTGGRAMLLAWSARFDPSTPVEILVACAEGGAVHRAASTRPSRRRPPTTSSATSSASVSSPTSPRSSGSPASTTSAAPVAPPPACSFATTSTVPPSSPHT